MAHVSHDLRTPLASLQGYLESLKLKDAELTGEERAEYLHIALRHSERLTRLVSELFELAKLDAKETRPQCESFALAELVQDVVQKFDLRAAQDKIRLTLVPARELPFVSADIALTERVLENLLANALNHTPGGGEVRISLEQGEGAVFTRISDTGSGIPETELPHIFAPFYRGHTSQPQGDEHAGLGLAIAKRIVELQSGEIRVESRLGAGTTFSFSLPMGRDRFGPA